MNNYEPMNQGTNAYTFHLTIIDALFIAVHNCSLLIVNCTLSVQFSASSVFRENIRERLIWAMKAAWISASSSIMTAWIIRWCSV